MSDMFSETPTQRVLGRARFSKCEILYLILDLSTAIVHECFSPVCLFQKCSSDSHCRARAAKLERVSTLQGVRVIETIDACECSPEASCKRESYIHLVHSGTPHQAVMDVGVCTGHCGKGTTLVKSSES